MKMVEDECHSSEFVHSDILQPQCLVLLIRAICGKRPCQGNFHNFMYMGKHSLIGPFSEGESQCAQFEIISVLMNVSDDISFKLCGIVLNFSNCHKCT